MFTETYAEVREVDVHKLFKDTPFAKGKIVFMLVLSGINPETETPQESNLSVDFDYIYKVRLFVDFLVSKIRKFHEEVVVCASYDQNGLYQIFIKRKSKETEDFHVSGEDLYLAFAEVHKKAFRVDSHTTKDGKFNTALRKFSRTLIAYHVDRMTVDFGRR